AQHHLLRASPLLLEEHRESRRSRDKHRRDGLLSRHRFQPAIRTSQGRAGGGCGSRRGRPVQMNETRNEPARSNAVSAPRILVVEDESDLALLLAYNLEAEGYVVESVARGDEAELRLAENAPDLVILDWKLPGVSGLEICRRLRAREATRGLPIIMV